MGSKLGHFLVSADVLCLPAFSYSKFEYSPLSLILGNVSYSPHTHLAENRATAELIGAPLNELGLWAEGQVFDIGILLHCLVSR